MGFGNRVGNWRLLVAKMINRGREYARSGVDRLPITIINGCYERQMFFIFSSGNRYMLVITENMAALETVEYHLRQIQRKYSIIYGSSFPKDQAFSQVSVMV